MAVAQVFKALGDPIRLEMVSRLSSGSSYTLSTVSTELGISRQGARKHLEVLHSAHLITLNTKGRDVVVKLNHSQLELVKQYITELEKQWDVRLSALKNFVEK